MRGVEDYEPSYKGYKAVPQGEQFFYVLTQKDPLQNSQEAVFFPCCDSYLLNKLNAFTHALAPIFFPSVHLTPSAEK